VGGWGRTIGDEGSGYFLGVEVVKVFTRILDGYLVSDQLSRAFSERLGWMSRAHLIASVYKERLELSTLAPFVMDLASQGIPAAQEILARGARALTDQVLVARARLPFPSVRVATLGGLIDTPTIYREFLLASLRGADPGLTVCFPDRTPVEGAIAMARAKGVS
jgi:N-acetylglucosamine kinase-like BadF-type ATPase